MTHRLDPLLRPESIAIVGASEREHTLGHDTLKNLIRGEFPGTIYPVNPKYEELESLKCYAELKDGPEVPDLVSCCMGDSRLEHWAAACLAISPASP